MELPETGTVFQSKYRLDRVLGEGGFARVYFAEDEGARRSVALKILKPKDGGGYAEDTESRFHREVRVVANLRDPHTVTMFDFGRSEDGLLFMVFEYIPGTDLSQLLKERQTISEPDTVHILEQVLRSLREAHQAGLLHRDIKPENIRIYEYMGDPLRVSLLDFGIARSAKPTSEQSAITHSGSLVGTPKYMSPEQLLEQELTAASDIYSLGLVAYEMLTGESAIGGNALSDQLRVLGSGTDLALPPHAPVGPTLRRVIDGMIKREPRERWQTCMQVLQELQPLSGSELTGSQPLMPLPRPSNPSGPVLPQQQNTGPNPHVTPPAPMPIMSPPTVERSAPQQPPPRVPTTMVGPRQEQDDRLSTGWLVGALAVVCALILAVGMILVKSFNQEEADPAQEQAAMKLALSMANPTPKEAPATPEEGADEKEEELPEFIAGAKDGCGLRAPFKGSDYLVIQDGLDRESYRLFIPKKYNPRKGHPLLILFHDVQQTPNNILRVTKFDELADELGFVVFMPKDVASLPQGPWLDEDDVRRVRFELQDILGRLCIDEDRIFGFGHGAGGRAVERLACDIPEVDATATSAYRPTAKENEPCVPDEPKPHLHIAAMLDRNSPAKGGPGCTSKLAESFGHDDHAISVDAQEKQRAIVNKCESRVKDPWATHEFGTCYAWDCENRFVSCRVKGGRNWPGMLVRNFLDPNKCDGDPVDFPYRDTIWRFFDEATPPADAE